MPKLLFQEKREIKVQGYGERLVIDKSIRSIIEILRNKSKKKSAFDRGENEVKKPPPLCKEAE